VAEEVQPPPSDVALPCEGTAYEPKVVVALAGDSYQRRLMPRSQPVASRRQKIGGDVEMKWRRRREGKARKRQRERDCEKQRRAYESIGRLNKEAARGGGGGDESRQIWRWDQFRAVDWRNRDLTEPNAR
jgi:hypothetical protein